MSHEEHNLPPGSDKSPAAAADGRYGTPPASSSSPYRQQPYTPAATSYDHANRPLGLAPAHPTGAGGGTPSSPEKAAAASSHELSLLSRWAVTATPSQFNALAGATGGFTSGVVVCPLDVIKTKLQAQGGFAAAAAQTGKQGGHQHRMYNGLVGTARVIWTEEGIRGMYRGLGPIILGYLPTWAVWFTVYNKSKVWMGQYQKNTHVVNFWSSIVAGACSTIVTNPIWVIKTRLMSQSARRGGQEAAPPQGRLGGNTPTSRPSMHSPWYYKSTLDAARKMYTTEGVLSFYSGLTPALLGLTHVAVQFPAYEFLKTKFTGQGMGAAPLDDQSAQGSHQWFGVLSASVLSKILASSATYPHEVIRTRLQTQRRIASSPSPAPSAGSTTTTAASRTTAGAAQPAQSRGTPAATQAPKYGGIVATCRTILREEGWRAFYAGMGANMMRAVPAAAVTMMTYEYVMRTLNQLKADGEKHLARD